MQTRSDQTRPDQTRLGGGGGQRGRSRGKEGGKRRCGRAMRWLTCGEPASGVQIPLLSGRERERRERREEGEESLEWGEGGKDLNQIGDVCVRVCVCACVCLRTTTNLPGHLTTISEAQEWAACLIRTGRGRMVRWSEKERKNEWMEADGWRGWMKEEKLSVGKGVVSGGARKEKGWTDGVGPGRFRRPPPLYSPPYVVVAVLYL